MPQKTTTKEIVQHQGWLWKRGEGYEGDEPSTPGPNNQSSNGTLKKGFKTSGAGSNATGGGTQNRTLDTELNLNAELLLTGIEKMLRGKGEKRRFFKLVTLEERFGPVDNSMGHGPVSMSMSQSRGFRPSDVYQLRVELRYYSKETADQSSLKGVIELSSDCEVVTKTDDANFKLITPGRCYFLRPDGDVAAANAITAAFQWSDAIRRQVRSLWALQAVFTRQASALSTGGGGSEGASTSPSLNLISNNSRARLLRAESALQAEPEPIPSNLAEVLADFNSRKEFRDFLETALASENLQFYEAVESLSTAENFRKRAKDIIDMYVVPGSAREVNLSSSQRSALMKAMQSPNAATVTDFDEAKAEVFKLMEDNFFKRFYRETLEKTGAFAALYATLGIDGFNAVLQHFGPVKTDLERTLVTYRSRLKRAETSIEQIRKELSFSSRDISVANQSTSRRALIAAYHVTAARLDALSEYADEMRNQVVAPLAALYQKIEQDMQTIHNGVREQVGDLEECKKIIQATKADLERAKAGNGNVEQLRSQLMECEVALENTETYHSKPIEAAMAKLESLELYRIETQRQIIRYATIAESNMMSEISKAAELFAIASRTLQVEHDIKELTLGIEKELSTHTHA